MSKSSNSGSANQAQGANSDSNLVEILDAAWREFEYRHHLYWDLVYKFTVAITFFIALPFVYSESVNVVKSYAFIFPVAGFALSILAWKILKTEAELMSLPHSKYRQLMKLALTPYDDHVASSGYKLSKSRMSVAILLYRAFLWLGTGSSLAAGFALYSTS